LRLWEKTEEALVLDEEREMVRDYHTAEVVSKLIHFRKERRRWKKMLVKKPLYVF
jgi:hypothetical protein